MARRSLKPELNRIRTWVQLGRTDAWIAHQLEVTVQQIDAFKRENDLAPAEEATGTFDEEIDLRAEDDALIAAELEEAEARRAEEEAAKAAAAEEEAARLAAEKAARGDDADEDDDAEADDDADDDAPKRRRGRRGGRGRARRAPSPTTFEGTFDHGEEGYGLWLDPAVADSPIYAEHWAGHRPVEVTVEEDQIVIRRAGNDDD
jgi:hypothetical protein